MSIRLLISVILFTAFATDVLGQIRPDDKVCMGTNFRFSVYGSPDVQYKFLREKYTNCSYICGNLELTWLAEDADLNFLKDIREVTGYILISKVKTNKIVLPRLQIIRGNNLFKTGMFKEEFAIFVSLTELSSVEMPALRVIAKGSAGFFNNINLCHINGIAWKDILSAGTFRYINGSLHQCPICHQDCEFGCWGVGEENCQKFTKTFCSTNCGGGSCFGSGQDECCHDSCIGGCKGPTPKDCTAYINYNINGELIDCHKGGYAEENAPINTSCDVISPKICTNLDETIHAGNIDKFKNCTILNGNINILQSSLDGFQLVYNNYTFGPRYPAMDPNQLEVFSTLKKVNGYISIQAYHPDFKNLTYFRNLEVIGGNSLGEFFSSLYIIKTSLESLGLTSLKSIEQGSVVIIENKHLCFAETVNWQRIQHRAKGDFMITKNGDLAYCKSKEMVCDVGCGQDGCWGTGSSQCVVLGTKLSLESSSIPTPSKHDVLSSIADPLHTAVAYTTSSLPQETSETKNLTTKELKRLVLLENLKLIRLQQAETLRSQAENVSVE